MTDTYIYIYIYIYIYGHVGSGDRLTGSHDRCSSSLSARCSYAVDGGGGVYSRSLISTYLPRSAG